LDEVLGALSADLRSAQRIAAANHGVGLVVKEAEVELAFTIEAAKEGGLGLNLRVFGVGVGGKAAKTTSEETVHRIKLTLQPSGGPSDRRRPVAR
jgi:hypothetical protein